ncbi:MAG: ABC transporter ATP-binding protein [Alphaproteobacteria bacterium]|nr:MAG: ABC transporter ATP-binding protein [Alphaproteobacteria bacterium]
MQNPMQNPRQNNFINMPGNGIAIAARGVAKTYIGPRGGAPKQALKGFDLDIPAGTVFGLLGPNGAGKSTFINIMAGTVIKSAGTVRVWGTDIDENPRQARANIGIVPQELNIDAYFTPRETLEMQAGLFGVPSSERRTDEILEAVGLTEQAHSYARRLSGGMRRRLLVAKAMVHSPPILVLDEPTAGVDVALRQRLWDNIRSLNEAGVTIVLTTHYLEEAEALCDDIAILNHGQLVANKPKSALMAGARAKEVRLTLAGGTPDDLPAALAALGARPAEGGIAVRYDPSASSVGAIIAAVATAGLEITDVTTDEPDLEEVFLEMTGSTA